MSQITLRWHDPAQTILIWDYPTTYTVADLYDAGERSRAMMQESSAEKINLVMMLPRTISLSKGNLLASLSESGALSYKLGALVFVSSSVSSRLLADSLRDAGYTCGLARNLDEAITFTGANTGVM